ncbi:MAG: ATP-dependent RecD-like DNA helicase [Bacilli bacterium]|nr:ATP-dependent RecD-like DNA helicase [Bacilli bacterium]
MKNYIKGTFFRLIYRSDQNYIVGLFKVKETNDIDMEDYIDDIVTFTGYFHELTLDEKYIFYGNLVDNNKYGFQYNVKEYERVMPEEKDAIIAFLSGDLFKGVGEKTATSIVETLGNDTLSLIEENYQNLLLVPNMKEAKAKQIHDTLSKYNESYNIIIELNKIGFSIRDSMKIYNTYKHITMSVIYDNIYNLMYDVQDINFSKIEAVRKNLNIDDNDQRRIGASIIYSMRNICFQKGDTYLYFDEVYNYVCKFLNNEIDISMFDDILNILQNEGHIVIEEDRYFLKEYFTAENNISNMIYYLINKKDYNYKNFDKDIDALEFHFNVKYNNKQKLAIKNAILKNFSIITGSPGTGKTTIIKAIVELYRKINGYTFDELQKRLVLLAPTGRASKKMSESCLYPAYTIHRFLKWNKEDNSFIINELNKSDVNFVIVDEVSMIDTILLDNLLKGLTKNAKIVFIGDYNQLESVSPGKILKDLIDSDMINVTYLTDIYRQGENSYISMLAKEIKEDDLSENFLVKKDDYSFIKCENNIKEAIKNVCEKAIEKSYTSSDIQVLAPMYKGENGIDNLNKELQSVFNKDVGQNYLINKDVIFRENDKILQLENDIDNNVFNGDIGYITSIKDNTLYISFDKMVVKYTPKDFDKIKHAYAISIHKAQGSEFKIVILPVCFSYKMMLYKKLIYTGVTRAKDNLTIIGDERAFIYSIRNNNYYERKTMLKDRLISLINE